MRSALVLFFCWGLFFLGFGRSEPQRIVSLAPSITRSLFYLGAEDRLVGVTSFCHIAHNSGATIVGSAMTVNLEKIITLRPNLVLTTAMTNPETIQMLNNAGITTKVLQTPRSFNEVCDQFEYLGRLVGRGAQASEINSKTKKRVAEIQRSNRYNSRPDFFFQIGANPLFTVLENTFMDDFITFFGGRNIATGLRRGTLNREFVLQSNPDVIIIMEMGIAGEQEKKIWENYPFLNAVKNNRIFFIDADIASSANPPDFLKTLEAIAKHLRPGWWTE